MKKKIFKRIISLMSAVMFLLGAVPLLSGCGDNTHPILEITFDEEASFHLGWTVKIELYPEWSPNSVNYIISQVQSGIYKGLPATKCVPDTMVVIGDGWNTKKISTVIKGEFTDNGFNGLQPSFEKGMVGMWHDKNAYDSCYGSIFFCLSDNEKENLDGFYAPVGRVIEGIEILYDASQDSSSDAMKYEPMLSIKVKEAKLYLHGETYPIPVTQERTDYPGMETR